MRFLLAALAIATFGCSSGADAPPDGGGGATGTGGAGGAPPGSCTFASTYTIYDGGGLAPMTDTATLTPPNHFHYQRRSFVTDAGQPFCAPALPVCPDDARVDVADVESAFAHADVQAAFAQTPIPSHGERNIADGPSFTVTRADGRGFNTGLDCSTPSPTCTPTPSGIQAARALLRALIDQQVADPSCDAFSSGG